MHHIYLFWHFDANSAVVVVLTMTSFRHLFDKLTRLGIGVVNRLLCELKTLRKSPDLIESLLWLKTFDVQVVSKKVAFTGTIL